MLFEWDESKRQSNLAKHRIDFQDALRIFDGPVFEKVNRQSRRRPHSGYRRDRRRRNRSGVRNPRPTPAHYFSQEGTSR
jgi:uncharacterized DUF497 family protein